MAKTRGIIESGKGNHQAVTTFRIQASGEGKEELAPVVKTTGKTVDVKLSAGATRAAVLVGDGVAAATDAILAAALVWASNRSSKRVWDVDVACALGYEVSPEGAQAFRKELGLDTPSTPWPTKPEQNPKDGPVVDRQGIPVKPGTKKLGATPKASETKPAPAASGKEGKDGKEKTEEAKSQETVTPPVADTPASPEPAAATA